MLACSGNPALFSVYSPSDPTVIVAQFDSTYTIMKAYSSLLIFPLIVSASASALKIRQAAQNARVVGTQKLAPKIKPNAQRTVYKFGCGSRVMTENYMD
jgi:hypothetical protein